MTGRAAVGAAAALLIMCGCRTRENAAGPMASAVLAVAGELGADRDSLAGARAQLREIANAVQERHRQTHGDIAEDIDAMVFGELGFVREVESTEPRFFLLPSVLSERRGTCLGLGVIYLAVGEAIGIPLDGILLPGHFFVRTRGPGGHNVELLRRGESMPDSWYRTKYGPWPERDSAYARPLSASEVAAIAWYNMGNHARSSGNLDSAERAYLRAATGFPSLAEAHASLGLVRQLRGALAEAETSYREAARLWPDLPGLEHNRARLRQTQEAARATGPIPMPP